MGRSNEFRHGDYNVICDRTGFKRKASATKREWSGSLVESKHWEPRHPQDFVRAVHDDQSVPIARPGAPNQFGSFSTTFDADEAAGQTVLSVASTSDMTVGDPIKVEMDNGEFHLSTISSLSAGDTVTLSTGLPYKATSGNGVYVYSNEPQGSAL